MHPLILLELKPIVAHTKLLRNCSANRDKTLPLKLTMNDLFCCKNTPNILWYNASNLQRFRNSFTGEHNIKFAAKRGH